jgi:hypothetical protein
MYFIKYCFSFYLFVVLGVYISLYFHIFFLFIAFMMHAHFIFLFIDI